MTQIRAELPLELQKASRWCATLARARMADFIERGLVPRHDCPTGTLTFLSSGSRTYAVTAQHVVDSFATAAKAEGADLEGYALPVGAGAMLRPEFVQPPGALPNPLRRPDIAIMPLPDGVLSKLGKEALEVRFEAGPLEIDFAVAVGFPTMAKKAIKTPNGEFISLPCAWAVAEPVGWSFDADQLQFYSEVSSSQVATDVDGMSGGPVFWLKDGGFGLLGFVKEARPINSNSGECSVHFICERAPAATLRDWLRYADEQHSAARERLNAKAREMES